MADQKVSELIEVTAIEDYDSIYVVVGGESRRIAKHNFAVDLEVAQADHADNADHALEADHTPAADHALETDKLKTARTFSLAGDCSGSTTFDGTANVVTTVVVANDSHTHGAGTIGSVSSAVVGNAIKTMGVGAVGSYCFARAGTSSIGAGTVVAGSSLTYASATQGIGSGHPTGTWQCMGYYYYNNEDGNETIGATLWMRVS
jgi:hypothetical protein